MFCWLNALLKIRKLSKLSLLYYNYNLELWTIIVDRHLRQFLRSYRYLPAITRVVA